MGPIKTWCLSNFWVGQNLIKSAKDERCEYFSVGHRKLLSIIIPLFIVQTCWWIYALITNSFYIFNEEIHGISRYYMSITMIFGSFIAGATSEGGASIAFPVMTIGFGILPSIARDFSFMIQSVGMSSAAFSILFMRLKIEYKSIIYCSIGGIFGIIISLQYISDLLPPSYSKMYYVSIWFSFAFSLFLLNTTRRDRVICDIIPKWQNGVIFSYKYFAINWKAIILLFAGFIGGIFSGIAGSGIDICSFAILTLLFRVSEKTATPTSIILMAINTLIGFGWRGIVQNEILSSSYQYFFVCIPIVVIGAPFGSMVASYLHRRIFANFIYIANISQLIGAFIIIQPWNISFFLTISSLVIIVIGGIIFGVISRFGLILINNIETQRMETNNQNKINDIIFITNKHTEQQPLLS